MAEKLKTFMVYTRFTEVEVMVSVRAKTIEDAIAQVRAMKPYDILREAEGFGDWRYEDITGVYTRQ